MTEMTSLVRSYFESAGWFEGRDVSGSFKFPEGKFISEKALDLIKQFGYLKVAYRCVDGDGFMYFDIDDSEASKVLRRDYTQQFFKYLPDDTPDDDCGNNKYIFEWETEEIKEINRTIKRVGIKLTRIGSYLHFLNNEIFIDETGGVWSDETATVERADDDFIAFCNRMMTGEKPNLEEDKAWYNQ